MSGFDRRPPSPGKGAQAQIQQKPVGPGKRTLVEAAGDFSPMPLHPVQRIDEAGSQQQPAVQRSAGTRGAAAMSNDTVQQVATQGVAGAGGSLPHLDRIQRLFGRHDVSGVEAHVGGPAAAASTAIGAQAYATGNHVAFAGTPSLHTAAHEAAHVVQQRGGVQLKGGIGHEGDPYEQHADAVADAVVQGNSAEALLSRYAEPHLPAVTSRSGVQRKVPTRGDCR